MRFDIVTIFPQMFVSPFSLSILKRAQEKGIIDIHLHDVRNFTTDRHRSVDDTPYGGGAGMVMRPEPLVAAVRSVPTTGKRLVLLLSPQGTPLTQHFVRELTSFDQLVLVCGRYEGVDERVSELVIDREISVGDFVASGGELPAMLVVDSIARCLPGVLGNELSAATESFEAGMLEHPQYTRPLTFEGRRVPDVLLSGDHQAIAEWRHEESVKRTAKCRPDLMKRPIDKGTKTS